MENEKVIQISINKENEKKLVLDLDSQAKEYATLDDSTYPLNLNSSATSILQEIITKKHSNLLKCANGYHDSGRNFYFFLYDLVSLAWYLEKLPAKFDKLKKIKPTDKELLHNRIHAQLAYHYQTLGHELGFENKNSKGRVPDLHIKERDVEVKTVLIAVENEQDSFLDFSKSFRNSHQRGIKQIEDGGIIIMGFRSQNINNIFKEYFKGMHSTKVPELKNNNTILVLEGKKVFEDFYMSLPSNQIEKDIKDFAESGYKRVPYAYLGDLSREGFPHGRQNAPGSPPMILHRFG